MAEELSIYEKLKRFAKEHKKEIYVAACFVVVFFVGFGTGRYDKQAQSEKRKTQSNYSKSSVVEQKVEPELEANKEANKPTQAVGGATADGGVAGIKTECLIKGNISSTGSKIYHVKGGAFYDRTSAEQCFNTEPEALAAGFRKSQR